MVDASVETKSQDSSKEGNSKQDETKEVKVKKKTKPKVKTSPAKGIKKKKVPPKKRKKKAEITYNVDVHPETGVMQLQELLYYKLIVAEQNVKIQERDLHIAKSHVTEFQTNANAQLLKLQAKAKEKSTALQASSVSYMQVVNEVEKETGLKLKDWTVDDERILRPIKQEKSD